MSEIQRRGGLGDNRSTEEVTVENDQLNFFDPDHELGVVERGLPHWSQEGVLTFITWRLADSLPVSVRTRFDREIEAALVDEGIDPESDWKQQLASFTAKKRADIQWKAFAARDKYLDQRHGQCLLAVPEYSLIVLESLQLFDGARYFLTDAVIMPNHVHFLCAFARDTEMLKQCQEWKRYTARKINERAGRKGALWQVDQFDHLVRSSEQFERYRRYISENPTQAGLACNEYRHYQKAIS